jgi:ABC-type multidrug transport system fused ATPase/permease subunit
MINLLFILLGFNKEILKSNEGGSGIMSSFTLLYILILSLSFYTCYYIGYLLSDNVFAAVLSSLFLTYILHNMYRLIIATSYEGNNLTTRKEIYKYISVKGFLVVILSIFISCSLCVSIFDSEINMELKKYKSNLISDYNKILDISYANQVDDLNTAYQDEKVFNLLMNKESSINDSLVLQANLLKIEQQKQGRVDIFNNYIVNSNFFLQRIRILSVHPKFWLITILIVLFFLLPLYIFNSSSYFLNYQLTRKDNNNKLVLEEYNNFKNTYINLLSAGSGQEITINERYEDPPFNTIPITREDMILQKGSLLEWLKKYHG